MPFKELLLLPGAHLLEPIKLCTMGNYRLPEAQSRKAGDVQRVGEVLLAHRSRHVGPAAREGGCRHQGPHKLTPEQAAFTGILGGGMTSPGANQGLPGLLSSLGPVSEVVEVPPLSSG